MVSRISEASSSTDRDIVITRLINAPRDLVFDVWTDANHIGEWWGPDGFTTTTAEIDVRPGGVWRFVMHGPDGVDYENKITFLELVRPERVLYLHGGGESEEVQFEASVTFDEQDGKTLVTLQATFATPEERDMVVEEHGAVEGGKQTLGRFAAFIEAKA